MIRANVMIVDDIAANMQLLAEMLVTHNYEVRPINSPKRAWEAIQESLPDIILLDINMPDMNGYDFCKLLKSDERFGKIPVIFISALDETLDKVRAFEVGGVDYITKPFQIQEVLARIKTHLELSWQRQEIEIMRRWETDYLRQMNQLKDDVLRIVSHDLKNPLGTIMGYAEILTIELDDHHIHLPNQERCLGGITRAAEKMLHLVHDLLDLARAEGRIEMQTHPVSLIEFLTTCYNELILQAQEKQLIYTFIPPTTDLQVMLAPDRFNQAVQNLLANAIKYTPTGGSVTLSAEADTNMVVIKVTDTGIGIPPEALPHLFEKFYRVERSQVGKHSGTGLGMAIAKAIVEQHHGKIEVDSQLGKGSIITIRLPH